MLAAIGLVVLTLDNFAKTRQKAERERQIAYAWTDPEMAVFGEKSCGNPCRVTYNMGGWAQAFVNMAKVIQMEGRQLVIDGPCGSACAIMADYARKHTCITPSASFHFHMATDMEGNRLPPRTSLDILLWVIARGGFPYEKSLKMGYADALGFWEKCLPES